VAFPARKRRNPSANASACSTYDEKPRRRLWELLKSQECREPAVVFLSDAATPCDSFRIFHPCSEHLIDWLHSRCAHSAPTQAKGYRPNGAVCQEVAKTVESVKHFPRHGNTEERSKTHRRLNIELDLLERLTPAQTRKSLDGPTIFDDPRQATLHQLTDRLLTTNSIQVLSSDSLKKRPIADIRSVVSNSPRLLPSLSAGVRTLEGDRVYI